ncbi:MAG: hypothetical protein Q7V88_12870 [Actinomycetota bacterium]|nr:hypothetical protein [Actinomycetota bacterium]
MDERRRAQLLGLKLGALVREHGGVAGAEAVAAPGDFGAGAALMAGTVAWVLVEDQPERGLGPALAWALRRKASELQVLAERGTGTLARRAEGFGFPINVWHVEGRTLLPAVALPLPVSPPVLLSHLEWRPTIEEGGALPTVEHGVLAGEVAGLEVCRVVDDRDTAAVRLEVGVGAHDRETFQLLHGNRPTAEALADVVQSVGQHRRPGSLRHPLNLLAQERLLRSRLIADPALIGATEVVAAEPPLPRANLKDAVPCVAVATIDGASAVVVCSVGVDLDVVPFALDARRSTGIEQCLVVVPGRDALDIQHRLAAVAAPPITIRSVDDASST